MPNDGCCLSGCIAREGSDPESRPLEQEHLGWSREVHVVGHSMGAMIATRLAALAPGKLASLTLISTTSGGFQIIPRSWRAVKYALQVRTISPC